MRKLSMDELNRKSVEDFKKAQKLQVIILLENIRSMHNVGSAFRTADAFLAEGIVLCGYTPKPPHRDIQKTALGATESVNWSYHTAAADAVRELKQKGYLILAVEQVAESVELQNIHRDLQLEKVVLIFGNEVEGVSEDILALCDACIEIPQAGTKHSLNISVAVGIVLWEFARKKNYRAVGNDMILQTLDKQVDS